MKPNPTVASSGQGPAWFFRLGLFDDICHATPDGMTRVIAFRLKSLSGSAGVPLSCATVARCQETRVKLHCFVLGWKPHWRSPLMGRLASVTVIWRRRANMTTALLYHHLKTVLEFKIVDDQMTVTLLRRELCPAREDAPFLEALVRSDSHVLIDQKKFRVRWRNNPLPEPRTIPSSCRHTIGTRTFVGRSL